MNGLLTQRGMEGTRTERKSLPISPSFDACGASVTVALFLSLPPARSPPSFPPVAVFALVLLVSAHQREPVGAFGRADRGFDRGFDRGSLHTRWCFTTVEADQFDSGNDVTLERNLPSLSHFYLSHVLTF